MMLSKASIPSPSSAIKGPTTNAMSPNMANASQVTGSGNVALCISTAAALQTHSSKAATLSTITPPSSAGCSGGTSSAGSHSPMMPAYRSSTEDVPPSTMMMMDTSASTEEEGKYWHLPHQDTGYLSPQNGGRGLDSTRMMANNESASPSLTYHRTYSTPNIHYSFSPETTISNGGIGAQNYQRFANYYQKSPNSGAGIDAPRLGPSNAAPPMGTASSHSGTTAGYSPLAFTHEQQAQYLYALYHQQLQAQVKEEQAQRLMMYSGSGFPQDSLMYYAGGRQAQATMESPTSTSSGSKVNNGSTSSSPTSNSPTIAKNVSPQAQQEMLGMGFSSNGQHAHYPHFRSSTESAASSSSSSSSGISTPPNSGSMSFTSSPASSSIIPSKENMMMMENPSVGAGVHGVQHQPASSSSTSSLFNLHHMPYSFYMGAGGASPSSQMVGVPQQHYGASQFSAAQSQYFGSSRGAIVTQQHPQHQMINGYHPQNSSAIHPMAHHPMISVAHHHSAGSAASTASIKICSNCGCTSTPSWRRCPTGKQLLCNACGLYQKLHNKPRPFCVLDDGSVKVQRNAFLEATRCGHCNTTETPLWRRGSNGQSLCNACGLYFKQHRQYRPSLPNTGWLSTGGYDAEIMNGGANIANMSNAGSGMNSSSSPAYQHYQHHQAQSSLHHQQQSAWLASGAATPLGGDGTCSQSSSSSSSSSGLLLGAEDENVGNRAEFHQHAHLQSPPENHAEDLVGDDSSAPANGANSVNSNQASNHGHHMMLAAHAMSPEDEAAVSALAEQMLDAQELFTREEDPSVLAAVAAAAAAAKIHHFERGGVGFAAADIEESVVGNPASC
ncbi:GATA-4/5/6 transcription factor [Mitosporidium daphniae]|uniref:GATA-4/5/6 transcription factor n=1 Tax=Mitosporidium daphniae TaxID=1485682 RepID=A0A098VMS8_9MICR|nr:GATA-4/5/6 transcription factor [Mitosporidium daphniae]KGG50119.1 GATA-4/5/6 transcription factor [Mitosporidium daphniae]|eukprot:XP_013236555.1 GATA-4/5/6 transcription factor [Mitosporidium daphniae]